MKYFRVFKAVISMLSVALFFFSCDKESSLSLDSNEVELNHGPPLKVEDESLVVFVSAEQALDVADAFFSKQLNEPLLRSGRLQKTEAVIETVKDKGTPF